MRLSVRGTPEMIDYNLSAGTVRYRANVTAYGTDVPGERRDFEVITTVDENDTQAAVESSINSNIRNTALAMFPSASLNPNSGLKFGTCTKF